MPSSVNNMTKEQAYSLIAALHAQATGQATVTPTDLSSFISVAQSTLQAGVDPVLNAIGQVLQATLFSVRPYSRKFKGLEVTTEEWGAIVRKINFLDEDAEEEKAYDLTDGTSIDQWVINKPKVLETHYVGSDLWTKHYTVTEVQLRSAFENPSAFGSFMTAVATHFSNLKEQFLEEMSRTCICNLIGAKADAGTDVIHLLTEYNDALGLTGTADELDQYSVKAPGVFGPFCKWMYARIAGISDKFTERSELFQEKITGKTIVRHTPKQLQRFYMLSEFLNHMKAEVLADTFNESFLNYADVEAVGYWQAIGNPDEIQVTPVGIDSNGEIATGNAQTLTNVIGLLCDRDALGYNIFNESVYNTGLNARGLYYNLWAHFDIRYENDLTEKAVVLCLD